MDVASRVFFDRQTGFYGMRFVFKRFFLIFFAAGKPFWNRALLKSKSGCVLERPPTGDSFGKPYSGAPPLRNGSRGYAYQRRARHRYWDLRRVYE